MLILTTEKLFANQNPLALENIGVGWPWRQNLWQQPECNWGAMYANNRGGALNAAKKAPIVSRD